MDIIIPISNLSSDIVRVNHYASVVLFILEHGSVTILSLRGVSEGGRNNEYLNRLKPQLLNDVRTTTIQIYWSLVTHFSYILYYLKSYINRNVLLIEPKKRLNKISGTLVHFKINICMKFKYFYIQV